jgi:uncharacterized protein (DUF2147 family)
MERPDMKTDSLKAAALATALLGASFNIASAAEPLGNWLTERSAATIKIARCGQDLCGMVIALREPTDPATGQPKTDRHNPDASRRNRPIIGVQIIFGMKPSAPNKWSGQVYNAEDGRTYTAYLTWQNENTIRLEGCVLGGMICQAQTWTRAG